MQHNTLQKLAHIITTPLAVRQQRLDICSECDVYDKDTDRCGECGCLMAVKATIPLMKCPKGRWEEHRV